MTWTGEAPAVLPGMLAAGALLWAAYSLVQVAVNGVILDETLVPAQIITGKVPYPPGHPHQVFYPTVFSFTNFLAAAQLRVFDDALALSTVRNVMFLFASTYVPFVFAVLLTGQPKWGHLAAVVMLAESTTRLGGVYPMWIFPNFYSHGHIGLYASLLAAGLLLARCWRTGGFLLGALPSVHASLAMLAWAWAAVFLFSNRGRLKTADRKRLGWSAAAGLTVCALTLFMVVANRTSPPFPRPYDGGLDGQVVYESFSSVDGHRNFRWMPLGYVLNPLAFWACGWVLLWSRGARGKAPGELEGSQRAACQWTMLLGGIAWSFVLAFLMGRWLLGVWPRAIEMLMPLRFSNATVVLLIPLVVAVAAAALRRVPRAFAWAAELLLAFAVAVAGLLLLLEGRLPILYPGRVKALFLFAFLGVVFGIYLASRRGDRARLAAGGVAAALVWAGLLISWRATLGGIVFPVVLLGSWMVMAGVQAALMKWAAVERTFEIAMNVGLAGACVFAMLAFLHGHEMDPVDYARQRWDTLLPYDDELNAWLARNANPGEPLLVPILPRAEVQAKTGHPALMELETLYLMSYMPDLCPSIGMMAKDLYGVDLSDPVQMNAIRADTGQLPQSSEWYRHWSARTREQWQAVGKKYGFRLLLASSTLRLDLPVALAGPRFTLYLIP